MRAYAGRNLETSLLQGQDEEGVHRLRGDQGQDGDPHGSGDILPRIKARRQHLDQNQAEQAHAVGDERLARHPEVVLAELSVMEQRGNQGHGQERERDGRGRGEYESQAQAPVEQLRVFVAGGLGMVLRQARKQHRAERDPQQPGRELHEPVGIVQPGNATVAEEGCDYRVDQEAHLGHGNADHGRSHQQENPPHSGVREREPRPWQHADFRQGRDL